MFPNREECEAVAESTRKDIEDEIERTPLLRDIELKPEDVIFVFIMCMRRLRDGGSDVNSLQKLFLEMIIVMDHNDLIYLPPRFFASELKKVPSRWSRVTFFFSDFAFRYGQVMSTQVEFVVWCGSILVDTQREIGIEDIDNFCTWIIRDFIEFLADTLRTTMRRHPEIIEKQKETNRQRSLGVTGEPRGNRPPPQVQKELTSVQKKLVREYIEHYPRKLELPIEELAEFLEEHLGMHSVHQEGIQEVLEEESLKRRGNQ